MIPMAPEGKKTGRPFAQGKRVMVDGQRAVINPRARVTKHEATDDFEKNLARAICDRLPSGLVGDGSPLGVDYLFVRERPKRRPPRIPREAWGPGLVWCDAKPDWDNMVKSAQDALFKAIGRTFGDDARVVLGRGAKAYAELGGHPRLVIRLRDTLPSLALPPPWLSHLTEFDPLEGYDDWSPL